MQENWSSLRGYSMIRVQGAGAYKVRVTPLRTAKTGPEWLPEINVNERQTSAEPYQKMQ